MHGWSLARAVVSHFHPHAARPRMDNDLERAAATGGGVL
jgi:hypothetical protein